MIAQFTIFWMPWYAFEVFVRDAKNTVVVDRRSMWSEVEFLSAFDNSISDSIILTIVSIRSVLYI